MTDCMAAGIRYNESFPEAERKTIEALEKEYLDKFADVLKKRGYWFEDPSVEYKMAQAKLDEVTRLAYLLGYSRVAFKYKDENVGSTEEEAHGFYKRDEDWNIYRIRRELGNEYKA